VLEDLYFTVNLEYSVHDVEKYAPVPVPRRTCRSTDNRSTSSLV